MAVSPQFKEFVSEQLAAFAPVTIRSMFGGAGIYHDEVMFALISSKDVLYFKIDDASRVDFEAEGMSPLTFKGKNGKPVSMAYYEVPERLYDDPVQMCDWARKAYGVAIGKKRLKRKRTRRVTRRTKSTGKK